MEGQGEYFFENGNVYVGQFLNNAFHGQGTIKFPGSGKYDATWSRGVASDGKYTFDDGLAYAETNWTYCTPEDRRYYTERDDINPAGRDQLVNSTDPKRVLPRGCYDVGDGFLNPQDGLVYHWAQPGKAIRPAEEKSADFPSELEWAKENCRRGRDDAPIAMMETEVAAQRIQAIQRGKLVSRDLHAAMRAGVFVVADSCRGAGQARKEAAENKKAATSVQSNFRGWKSRQTMKQKAAEAEAAEQAAAATKIAAMHRGKAYRKERAEQEAAAVKMQAIQRGRMSRGGNAVASTPASPAVAADTEIAYDPEEVDAATLIQSQMRGRATRREMAAEREQKAIEESLGLTGSEEEAVAIARIQASQRGKMTRKQLAEDRREQEEASRKIQAIQRGKQDRAKVAGMRAQKIEAELGLTGSPEEAAKIAKLQAAQRGKMARKELAEQQAAASKIAAVQRGKQDRARVAGMKVEKELGLTGSPEEESAASKIAAVQRGKQDRARVAAMKAEKGEAAEEEAAPTGNDDEAQAAAKIQAMHRGKMTRQEIMEQQAAASKIAAVQRGKQDRARVQGMKIEKELGLTGSEEERARIAKMQAAQRGKMARKQVAAMKEGEAGAGVAAETEAPVEAEATAEAPAAEAEAEAEAPAAEAEAEAPAAEAEA